MFYPFGMENVTRAKGMVAKGRAALSNAPGRFERHDRVAVDDGWDIDEDLAPLRTQVTV
jgi:hypothetical protein